MKPIVSAIVAFAIAAGVSTLAVTSLDAVQWERKDNP